MICYRDMQFCSHRECANLDCRRNQATIDKAHLEKVGLPIAVGDMKTDDCGYVERCWYFDKILDKGEVSCKDPEP